MRHLRRWVNTVLEEYEIQTIIHDIIHFEAILLIAFSNTEDDACKTPVITFHFSMELERRTYVAQDQERDQIRGLEYARGLSLSKSARFWAIH